MLSLLTAKFVPPPAQSSAGLVARPRLLARLDGPRPVTLLAAPAGFGKTTLAAEWLHQQPAPAAWLTLDPADNDPARFLAYLVAALDRARPGVGASALTLLQSPQPAPVPAILTALANDLAALPASAAPLPLVLDDYHHLETEGIHAAVEFLAERAAPPLRLILTSRAEPDGLPLARWRARGRLTSLGPADLRFTSEEAQHFLTQVMGLALADDDIAHLAERTEGWAAGLQLAALALQSHAPSDPALLAAGQRYLSDYLLHEVFGRQPPDVQVFLRQVSILERLTGSLCATLTGRALSDALLDRLARANLFLTRLDADTHGEWYRLHPLFREFLLAQLAQSEPLALPGLHQRAAVWFEQHGLTAEAVDHALAAGDAAAASRLVAAAAPALQQRGEFATLRHWLDRLPEEAVWANPRLCIARAWLLLDAAQSQQAAAYLERFDAFLAAAPAAADWALPSASLRGEFAALRAVFAAMRLDSEQALAFARLAEQQAPADDAFVQPYVAFSLGAAYKMSFDSMRAEQSLRHAGALADAAGHTYLAYTAFGNLADVQFNTGRLADALQSNRRALAYVEQAGVVPPWAGWIYWAMSRVHYELNDLPAAQSAAERAVDLCAQWGNTAMGARAQQVRVQLALARRRFDDARAALDDADHLARQSAQPRLIAAVTRLRLLLALALRDLDQARQWAAALPPLDSDRFPYFHFIILARLELAAGQPARAIDHLASAWRALEPTDLVTVRLQVLVLEAVARRARGQSQQAQAVLERALALAQPGGFVRTFVDEGAPVQELLRRSASAGAASRGPLAEYAQELLAAFAAPATSAPAIRLTPRERQILRLLALGLSNRAMAAQLVVTPATLKRHLSNLYLKLDAHSRTQALARAAALGLL